MNIIANTESLKNNISELEKHQKYFSNKKNSFTPNSYETYPQLSSYLKNIQSIYTNISSNLTNLNNYLKDYTHDLENIEKISSNQGGFVKVGEINNIINNYKDTIKNYNFENTQLFETNYIQK